MFGKAVRHSALTILGAAIGMAGGFAVLISGTFGIFIKPVGESMGWSRGQVSLLPTMAFLGYALGSPLIGWLYDRIGVVRVQAAAIVCFAAVVASLSVLPDILPLYGLAMLVIGLTAAATSPSGYVLILTKSIRHRLGLAIACAMVGLGVGVAVAPALAQGLIAQWGWRMAYLGLAGVGLAAGAMALLLGVGRRVSDGAAAQAAAVGEGLTLRQAVAGWRFWLLGGTSLMVGMAGFGILAHLAAALSDIGVASGDAVRMAGLLGVGILVGRIVAAMLMDRFFAPAIAMLFYGLGGVGLFLIAHATPDQRGLLYMAALAAGLLTGSEGDTMPFLTRHYFGLRAFGSVYGCIVGMAGLGGLLGPLVYGVSFDLTGGYGAILTIAAIACALCGILLLLLGPYRFCISSSSNKDG